MKLRYENRFNALGYSLSKFNSTDTRANDSDETPFHYYAAQGGRLVERFHSLADARDWIECRESLNDLSA